MIAVLEVSERWAPTIASSHVVARRVEVWRGDELVVPDLPVSGGTVSRDYGAKITMSASVEVADPAYLPVDPGDPLMPLGNELRIHIGVRHPGNVEELVQVFSGPIVAVPTWPTASGGFTVRAEGWLRYVADDDFLAPYSPTGTVLNQVSQLLLQSVPAAAVLIGASVGDRAVPDGLLFERDRMEAVEDLALSVGAVVRETPAGGFSVAPDPLPDPAADPVRSFIHGEGGALLEGSSPELSREERYNAVVAYNEGNPDVRAVATVDDPASPVRWGGPFGRKVMFYSNPVLTAGIAAASAQARLDELAGRMRQITAQVPPDPSLEPGDHVLIRWPRHYGAKAQIEELAMIRKVEHPLGLGTTRLELRGTGG